MSVHGLGTRELNKRQVLFEYGHKRYWYLGDRVLAQVQHIYPPEMILAHPCPSIRLIDFLTNKEIAHARIGHVVLGILGDYLQFVKVHL